MTSPLFGYRIPPLNTRQLFLRGTSNEKEIGVVEEDTIPEHGHTTIGHTHYDSGHRHIDKGHDHNSNPKTHFEALMHGSAYGDSNGTPRWATTGILGCVKMSQTNSHTL